MMDSKIFKSIVITSTFAFLFAQQWRVPVIFHPTSSGTRYPFTLFFGTKDGASEYYDPFLDIPEPIFPPSGFVAYFIGDTLMPYLREDYRPVDVPGEPAATQLWQLSFRDTAGTFVSVVWEADSFPFTIVYPIYMQFLVADHIPDAAEWSSASTIAESESIYVSCSQSVFFCYRDITRIEENIEVPQNINVVVSPNPFNSSCKISASGCRRILISDIKGNIMENIPISGSIEFLWAPKSCVKSGLDMVHAIGEVKEITITAIFLK